jgi:type I restriction enzyme S subunit
LKRVHFQSGKFALADLLVAAIPKDPKLISARFLARYLNYTKDRLIVPLMKGTANMSLSRTNCIQCRWSIRHSPSKSG